MWLLVVRLALRYCQKTLPSAIAIATRKIALATTFTCGGTATRAMPQTKTGNVCVAARIEVRDDEVVDREREARAARRRASPARCSGSVTLRNVVSSFAPRSIAASSRCRSNPIRRAFTVTTMKLTMNITCAMKIVQKPSWKTAVVFRNSVRSDAPRTISGVDIGQEDEEVRRRRGRRSGGGRSRAR